MELGYIYFSEEERGIINQVSQAMRGSEAIDELGLGRVRDFFSNEMFPGMSTLHNRAKYYALLPFLYKTAEKKKLKDQRAIKALIRELEVKLTKQLWIGTTDPEQRWGITGSTLIDRAEQNINNYVKYDPTYIYWGALTTFGMVKCDGNLHQLIAERSIKSAKQPELYKRKNNEEGAEDEDGNITHELFDTGGLSYVLDGKTPISIELNREEAAFIKRRMVLSPYSKDKLLGYILSNNIPIVSEFLDLDEIWDNVPDHLYMVYKLSQRFSKFQYLLRLIYNYSFYKKTKSAELAEAALEKFYECKESWIEDIKQESMREVIDYIKFNVKHRSTCEFCERSCEYLLSSDDDHINKLVKLIEQREIETKGITRSKLANSQKYNGMTHADAYFLDYRWGVVYNVINEIRNALKNE